MVGKPQEGNGLREEVQLRGWISTLKGGTPRAGPARNKAGRCLAEQGLGSVRNAVKARTRGVVPLGMSGCQTPGTRRRGRKPHGRLSLVGDALSAAAPTQWFSGGERKAERGLSRRACFFRTGQRSEALKGQPCEAAKTTEGAQKPIRALAPLTQRL